MDRLIYTAMSGAKHLLEQQAVVAHNLANANTTGFRAELSAFRAVPVVGEGANTRAFVVDSTVGADLSPGVIQQTGRPLDVALRGRGFIAVQTADGEEVYTRNGNFHIGENGLLQTRDGLTVIGDGGPVSVPPDTVLSIAPDGTISTVPTSGAVSAVATVGRIKLVDPDATALMRGDDGLFRLRDGGQADAAASVQLTSGALESSNVNVVEAMVSLIENARQYDLQMKILGNADTNARDAASILSVRG
jgi:flagellar basal-body rod protein FlgF